MPNIISLEFSSLDLYSLSVYSNNIPLIDEIIVRNISDYHLKNLEVEITSSPAFFSNFTVKVPYIASDRYVILDKIHIDIDATKIMYSSYASTSVMSIKVKSVGEVLAEVTKTITLLPYDHIPPVDQYSELLSTFVTPNQDVIKDVSDMVFEKLKSNPEVPVNSDMWNLSDRNIVHGLSEAIYDAIRDLRITLNTLNVFNENKVMQVKLPETTVKTRSGSGFEIALLVSSLAEHLGLHSFIILTGEKTLVGFFYAQDDFGICVSDDGMCLSALENGSCDRFFVVDTTSMMNGTHVPFDSSKITAQKAIDKCDFPIVVDITCARKKGYMPLPNRVYQNGNLIFEVVSASTGAYHKHDVDSAKTPKAFSEFVKKGICPQNSSTGLKKADPTRSIFLVGGARYIISKLYFNGKVSLKSSPSTGFDFEDISRLYKLSQLNANVDASDMSNNVNTLHDKDALNKLIINVINDGKESFSNVCLCAGAIKYSYNDETIIAPLFLMPVAFESDSTQNIYLRSSSGFAVNTSIVDILASSGIDTSFIVSSVDVSEDYDRIAKQLSNAFEDHNTFDFFDVTFISTYKIDALLLTKLASDEYFSSSAILNDYFNGNDINEKNEENEIFDHLDLPFSLDSSQLQAVKNSIFNRCTVIKGANVSGKTQVASSIAFNELRKGNKVLYLTDSDGNHRSFMNFADQAGFIDLIYDIPQKNKILNNFDSVINYHHNNDRQSELSEKSEALKKLINSQNSYYENLHTVQEIGFSLYEAASQYERYRTFPYSVNFNNTDISHLTRDDVVTWFDTVSSVAKAGADCKEPHSNPLSYVKAKNFSYDLKSRSTIALSSHIALTQRFIELQSEISEFLGIEIPIMKEKQTVVLSKMLECIKNNHHYIHHGIFLRHSHESDFAHIEALLLKCDDFLELRSFIFDNFTEDVVSVDCDSLLAEWRSANSKSVFSRSSAIASAKNKLKAYSIDPKFITNENFASVLSKLSRFKNTLSLIEEYSSEVYQITGIDIKSKISESQGDVFRHIAKSIEVASEYLALIDDIYDTEQRPNSIFSHQNNLFKNSDKLLESINTYHSEFSSLYDLYCSSEKEITELLDLDIISAKDNNAKIWYYFVQQFFERMNSSLDLLKYWCNWNVEKEKAISLGLENVIKLYESEQLTSGDIKNAFLKGFFKSVTEFFLSSENGVGGFSSDVQRSELDSIYNMLSEYRKLLSADMRSVVKNNFDCFVSDHFENLLVCEELLKKDFSFDINTEASDLSVALLQKAKPCFVCASAGFLSKFKSLPHFDTIIVDNSSTLVQESLFMLLPITKKIVVVDTSSSEAIGNSFSDFFIKNKAPVSQLSWLYNNNYSSQVINELFYGNTLSSFVCSTRKKVGLNIIRQSGTYDCRNTRVNVIEASATVDELVKLNAEHPNRSLGVYTMTEEQRDLIEILYYKRIGKKDVRKSYDHNLKEPFFIRCFNQSDFDPRDVILFSTVYSVEEKPKYNDTISKAIKELYDSSSISSLINIITSARRNLTLVTSLTQDIIDNFKTTEKNYRMFKKTILRLLSEKSAMPQDLSLNALNENSIVREVANHIESLGYAADFNLGINKCKIDIAVRTKGKNQYLLGIVFDESPYINSDDFFGRELIIKGLEFFGGWKILRIFTVEWFENYSKQLDIISSVLNGDQFDGDLSINQNK